MGKPYGHQFFFKGCTHQHGRMICCHCNKPVSGKDGDWGVYQKTIGNDWKYVTFHRSCHPDQSGWVKQEQALAAHFRKKKEVLRGLLRIIADHHVDAEFIVDLLESESDEVFLDALAGEQP